MSNVVIRKAEKKDCYGIKILVHELADYHTPEIESDVRIKDLEIDGFGENIYYKCLVAEKDTPEGKRIVGYLLYYYKYSSLIGRNGYMEGLHVTEEFRFSGIGGKLLKSMFKEVMDVGCSRILFSVLSWNAPSVKFYKKYGAVNLAEEEDWRLFRIEYNEMAKMVEKFYINGPLSLKSNNQSNGIGNMTVRKGEIRDCTEIIEHIKEHHKNNLDGVKINAKVLEADGFGDQKLYNVFIAEEETPLGKKIIGYVIYIFGFCTYAGRDCFMDDLFVTKERRHMGLGAALWKAVIQDALQNGVREFNFTVTNCDTRSITFFQKYGAYNQTERYHWEANKFDMNAMKKIIA